MGLAPTMTTGQANLGTKCPVSAVPRRSRQKTSKATTRRRQSKIPISTTDAESPSISRTLHRALSRVMPCFEWAAPHERAVPGPDRRHGRAGRQHCGRPVELADPVGVAGRGPAVQSAVADQPELAVVDD